MTTKLKVAFGDSLLEVEGTEELVIKLYDEFKGLLASRSNAPLTIAAKPSAKPPANSTVIETVKSPRAKKGSKTAKSFQLLKNLDLRPNGKISLKDFVAQFDQPSKDELYLLFIHYLQDTLGEKVTVDHIYTCLDEMNERVPTHLKQTITNSKNDKGWIDTADFSNLDVTVKGKNHLKHDIARVVAK